VGVLRHVVFPALRLVVWAVIAAALVWLAFGRGTTDLGGTDGAQPSVELTPPETSVARGDVVNEVSLEGTVQSDAATEVRATGAGEVARLRVAVGEQVDQGAPILDVTVTEERPDRTETLPDGTTTTVPQEPTTRTEVVRTSAAGTVGTLAVLEDQLVSVGDVVATVSSGALSVVAPLTQEQQFRLLAPPSEATVTVPGGPGPFACTDVRAGVPEGDDAPPSAGGASVDPYADPGAAAGTPTGAEVSCRVPADAVAFPGLSATLELTAGSAQDVLVLPVTAVQGLVSTGAVWRVDPATGEASETQVGLGLTDGTQVEVTEGLEEGDSVLEFVPGSDDAAEDPYAMGPFG